LKPKTYADPVKIRLQPDDLTRLQKLSGATGVPLQELVRACVHRALPYVEKLARSKAGTAPD
jgi:predicted DNA binding CopG/RHH family protein